MSQKDNDDANRHDTGSKSENKSGHTGDKTKNSAKKGKVQKPPRD